MLPLGESWGGICRTVEDGFQPEETVLRQYCNLGYARRGCPRFPPEGDRDAVRFTISGHTNNLVDICYVVERNHYPFVHGCLTYSTTLDQWTQPAGEEVLQRQVQAYLESYLRRKKEL